MNKLFFSTLILFSFSAAAFAQEDGHAHSDVEFSYVEGAIEVEAGEEGFVFEGEFGEGAFSSFASEPGIASEIEEGAGINPGNIIAVNVLDNLFYWDGSQVASPGTATPSFAIRTSASLRFHCRNRHDPKSNQTVGLRRH